MMQFANMKYMKILNKILLCKKKRNSLYTKQNFSLMQGKFIMWGVKLPVITETTRILSVPRTSTSKESFSVEESFEKKRD